MALLPTACAVGFLAHRVLLYPFWLAVWAHRVARWSAGCKAGAEKVSARRWGQTVCCLGVLLLPWADDETSFPD